MAYMTDSKKRRLDSIRVPATDEVVSRTAGRYSTHALPAPVLDLDYASKMALAPYEIYARAATLDFTNGIGGTETAAINAPAFEHVPIPGQGTWRSPMGLKAAGSGYSHFNPLNIIPTANEFTIVVDVHRPETFTGAGVILAMHAGTIANRIEIGINATYQPYALVQAGGTVTFNAALGPSQGWYGRTRRLVLSVKSGAFSFADSQSSVNSQASGSIPSRAAWVNLDIGGNSANASYFTGWIRRVQILPRALTAKEALDVSAGTTAFACWGDSLTAGTGATGISGRYPEALRAMRWPVSGMHMGGVGGETSTQIKARMVADTLRADWTTVIWAGRNNYADLATVLADVAEMVGHLTHRRFLVMSVINKANLDENAGTVGYGQIMALNAALAAAYPNNYMDIRSMIVAASAGINDSPNTTWTADGLHLNNTGYAFVADQVGKYLSDAGWY
jgi:lysophospholipase L1-like esterase